MGLWSFLQDRMHFLISGVPYGEWEENRYSLITTRIQNRKLAQELEDACSKNGGVLTYSEYIQIEQFGNNGYHATHKAHGMTATSNIWAEPLAHLSIKNNLQEIVEFGSGDGKLALSLVERIIEKKKSVVWNGIEINKELADRTVSEFKKRQLSPYLGKVVENIDLLEANAPSLVIFSYSLDSIPPEIFVNTSRESSYPNAIIGVSISDGILREVLLTREQLQRKGKSLLNGIYKDENYCFYLKKWLLSYSQRLYLSVGVFSLLLDLTKRLPKGSMFAIIDEMRGIPSPQFSHLSTPVYLYKTDRHAFRIKKAYEEAGKYLFYYPLYFTPLLDVLSAFGIKDVRYDTEEKLAQELMGKILEEKRSGDVAHYCYAIIASIDRTLQFPKSITIQSPRVLEAR